MAIRSMFFDSVGGDRVYTSDAFSQIYTSLYSEGLIQGVSGDLQVIQNGAGDMTVNVQPGAAWIKGKYFELYSGAQSLNIAASNPTLARIDSIVIRYDITNRSMALAVLTGTAAASPVAPTPANTASVYEYVLATVLVAAAATAVFTNNITTVAGYSVGKSIIQSSGTVFPANPRNKQTHIKTDWNSFMWYDSTSTAWQQFGVPSFSGSFPTGMPVGFRVFRSDRSLEYFWNGTNWLTTQKFILTLGGPRALNPFPQATTTLEAAIPEHDQGVYFEKVNCGFLPNTAQSGSNYYTITFSLINSSTGSPGSLGGGVNTSTFTTAGRYYEFDGAVATGANTSQWFQLQAVMTPTGNPGTFYWYATASYRLVG